MSDKFCALCGKELSDDDDPWKYERMCFCDKHHMERFQDLESMSVNDAQIIEGEALFTLLKAKEACPGLWEWAMAEMDMDDYTLERAYEVLRSGGS